MDKTQFIATKFQPPFLRPNRLIRSHLLQKLVFGRENGGRLTLISAPAGYGKTTLVTEWLREDPNTVWVSLEDTDNDPNRFFTCLVTALEKEVPSLGQRTRSLLGIPQMPPAEIIAGELINEINDSARSFTLILDDYHNIHTLAIHEAVEVILNHQPDTLHLVIVTREDPPFPLSRLRARGQLTEIRARDLRFSITEVQEFMHQAHLLNLSTDAVEHLAEVTEGWAAGLQLVGLALQQEEDPGKFLSSFGGSHQYIIEYLVEEVLRRQPPEIREFLHSTAILERFNASLCKAVMDNEVDARVVLAELERSNMFLAALDASREWFRYHRLFSDVLRASLNPEKECTLHARAAWWFEQQGLRAEAIDHYLSGKQPGDAARLIRGSVNDLICSGEINTLLKWIQALPTEEMLAHPRLVTVQALALLLTGQTVAALQTIQAVEQRLDPSGNSEAEGPLLAIKAWLAMVTVDMSNLRDLAQRALAALDPEDTFFRVLALIALGTTFMWKHDLGAANEAFQEAYVLSEKTGNAFSAMAALANLAFNLYDMGKAQKARALCLDALTRYSDHHGKPLPVAGLIQIPLGTLYLEQNDLEQAKAHTHTGLRQCQRLFSSTMMGGDAEWTLAQIAFRQGETEQAFHILEENRRLCQERHVTFLVYKMTLMEAYLHLWAGNVPGSRACMEWITNQATEGQPDIARAMQVIWARIHAAEGKYEKALTEIIPLEQAERAEGLMGKDLNLLILKAYLLKELGRTPEATAVLEEAVRTAAPEGYVWTLLQGGTRILPLLPAVRAAAPAFIDEITRLLSPRESQTPQEITQTPQIGSSDEELAEPLSEQERNVLRLLAAGLSNQEIADQLVISAGTAKWHVHNILAKLGASSRAQAAARARELKLIP